MLKLHRRIILFALRDLFWSMLVIALLVLGINERRERERLESDLELQATRITSDREETDSQIAEIRRDLSQCLSRSRLIEHFKMTEPEPGPPRARAYLLRANAQ